MTHPTRRRLQRDRCRLGGGATRSPRAPPARCAKPSPQRSSCSTAARCASPRSAAGDWSLNQWLKKAVLLSFRLTPIDVIAGRPGGAAWWDKVPLEFAGWGAADFDDGRLPRRARRDRAALGLHRAGRGADAVLRQHRRLRRQGTMVDTWATVGSCAQIGKNVPPLRRRRHRRRAGAAAGQPDDHRGQLLHRRALRGGRGRHRRRRLGAVDGRLPRRLDQDRRPRDRRGPSSADVPPYSVVVAGSLPGKPLPDGEPGPSLYCAVIVKTVDAQTRSKTSINELLRD